MPVSRRRKTIFDPIHGSIALEGPSLDLVQHPAFQRLWGIRQTGLAHLVFPGANHTRLEHSLGVYGVARQMAETLALDRERSETLACAGLLHDLGHGPFSHTLEPSLREARGFGHERRSRDWILGAGPDPRPAGDHRSPIPRILERHGLDPREVAELVDPSVGRRPSALGPLLHGAIDADRIDYLQRDAHYTGVAHGMIDGDRLRETVRLRAGRIVFAEKGRNAVEGFLVGRALMYSAVYYHKTVRAAEVMAQSAVERLPEFPSGIEELFGLRDGELLSELRTRGRRPKDLAERLLDRRLFKRAWGIRALRPSERRRWTGVARSPARRRALEDRLADALGLPRGDVLLDLAGVAHRAPSLDDWGRVAVLEGDRIVHPFRSGGSWWSLARRPPTLWAVSAYVPPERLPSAGPALGRAARRVLS